MRLWRWPFDTYGVSFRGLQSCETSSNRLFNVSSPFSPPSFSGTWVSHFLDQYSFYFSLFSPIIHIIVLFFFRSVSVISVNTSIECVISATVFLISRSSPFLFFFKHCLKKLWMSSLTPLREWMPWGRGAQWNFFSSPLFPKPWFLFPRRCMKAFPRMRWALLSTHMWDCGAVKLTWRRMALVTRRNRARKRPSAPLLLRSQRFLLRDLFSRTVRFSRRFLLTPSSWGIWTWFSHFSEQSSGGSARREELPEVRFHLISFCSTVTVGEAPVSRANAVWFSISEQTCCSQLGCGKRSSPRFSASLLCSALPAASVRGAPSPEVLQRGWPASRLPGLSVPLSC